MSYKENIVVSNGPVQLVDKSRFGNSVSQGGVTCTNNGDGSWTINGNVTAENRFNLNFYQLGANVIPYWLSPGVPVEHNYYTQDCYYDKLGGWLYYYLEEGKNYENFKIYPQIISLTDTFGSGNEPKNKEQVKAKFPDNLYPYNPTNRVTTYKELIKVSDVCQLLDKRNFETRSGGGTTATYNNDGTFTVSGTATADSWKNFPIFQLLPGGGEHVYLFNVVGISNDTNCYCNIYFYDEITYRAVGLMQTGQADSAVIKKLETPTVYQARFNITTLTGATPNNIVYKPQLFDLTEMFGPGNEPKTVAEFKQKFPDELYPYSPNCWLTSYRNVSKVGDVCQLHSPKNFRSGTSMNVSFESTDGKTWVVNGTSDYTGVGRVFFQISNDSIELIKRHCYLIRGATKNWNDGTAVEIDNNSTGTIDGKIFEQSTTKRALLYIAITRNPYTDAIFKPQLFDLTEMYGEGKEPKTVEEFRAKFPNEMYDYNLCCTV